MVCSHTYSLLVIWRVFTPENLQCTVGETVIETCYAIATHLLSQYVYIPQGRKLKETIEGFETYWGFPQAAGAIDGSHIPILRPDESASDYYNRKGITL